MDLMMLALTLKRPWDAAMVYLDKDIENRKWPPPPGVVGTRIALHAGLGWDDEGEAFIRGLIGPAVWLAHKSRSLAFNGGMVLATVKVERVLHRSDLPLDPKASSRWFFGPYGWVCTERIVLRTPIRCRGMQKLWRLPPEVEAAVIEQEGRHVEDLGHPAG